jgi:hypothetical protein
VCGIDLMGFEGGEEEGEGMVGGLGEDYARG